MSQTEIKAYLAKIGAKGGAKSRRKLSKAQAKAMAAKRWSNTRKAISVGRGRNSTGGSGNP